MRSFGDVKAGFEEVEIGDSKKKGNSDAP